MAETMPNAFQSVRPRGADAPAKLPVQRKTAKPITTKGTTRVMNARGVLQANLAPDPSRSISIESREQAQASNSKTRRISKAGTK
ncbi:hypothetical protein [Simplicispira piscis]